MQSFPVSLSLSVCPEEVGNIICFHLHTHTHTHTHTCAHTDRQNTVLLNIMLPGRLAKSGYPPRVVQPAFLKLPGYRRGGGEEERKKGGKKERDDTLCFRRESGV